MKVLIINSYEDSKYGLDCFNDFLRCMKSCIREASSGVPDLEDGNDEDNYTIRKANALADYVVDYKFEMLSDRAENACKLFDNLDLILLGGDMTMLPWDPKNIQVVTLMHMAAKTHKPVITTGGCAFSAIYAACTGGTKFHILNGPHGETIDRLPNFPRYGASTAGCQFPSAWMDNATGDLYTYDAGSRVWHPICNVGVFRTGDPRAASAGGAGARPISGEKKFVRTNEPGGARGGAGQTGTRERVIHIHSQNSHHAYTASLFTLNFPVTLISDHWNVSWAGKLPPRLNIETLADGTTGPVLLTMDTKLLMACEIKDTPKFVPLRKIIVNYLKSMQKSMSNNQSGKLCTSLHEYLFGVVPGTGGRCRYEMEEMEAAMAAQVRKSLRNTHSSGGGGSSARGHSAAAPAPPAALHNDLAPPLSGGFAVSTKLPSGPVKVDAPLMNMLMDRHAGGAGRNDNIVYADGGPRAPSMPHHQSFQNPKLHRRQRLETLLTKQWAYDPAAAVTAAATSPQTGSAHVGSQMQASGTKHTVVKNLLDAAISGGHPPHTHSQSVDSKSQRPYPSIAHTDEELVQDHQLPDSARDILSGTYMDEHNIKRRTGQQQQYGHGSHVEPSYYSSTVVTGSPLGVGIAGRSESQSYKVPAVAGWQDAMNQHAKGGRTRPKSGSHAGAKKSPNKARNNGTLSARGAHREPGVQQLNVPLSNPGKDGTITGRMQNNLLFVRHPNSARVANQQHGHPQTQSQGEGGSPEAAPGDAVAGMGSYVMYSPYQQFRGETQAVHLSTRERVVPFNNLQKFEDMKATQAEEGRVVPDGTGRKLRVPYSGAYHEHYKSPAELEAKDQRERKTKFLSGTFQRHFGVASQIPLRQKGGMQAEGPYLGGKESAECGNNIGRLRGCVDVEKQAGDGPWK